MKFIQEMIALLNNEASRYIADRVQVQPVLMNLMLNGIDAMKDVSPAGQLTVSSRPENGQMVISVSDIGVGLPPEGADQVFESFFTTKPHGTGMGLAISRSIIESHGGCLWATANSGWGATFQFSLPAQQGVTAAA